MNLRNTGNLRPGFVGWYHQNFEDASDPGDASDPRLTAYAGISDIFCREPKPGAAYLMSSSLPDIAHGAKYR
jgi:hypothetical protein